MEIVPGLHRLRTPMTSEALPWIMPYAFEGVDGVTLFDSGYGTPEASEWLTQQLHGIGYQPADIQRLIVSHGHADHLGMAEWIKEQSPGCELIMLAREADWFKDQRHDGHDFMSRAGAWLVRHGVPREEAEEGFRLAASSHTAGDDNRDSGDVSTETERRTWSMPRVDVDVRLQDGDVLEFDNWKLEAVWTPGHTPGHLCIYEAKHKLMLTGDHVLSRITPNVSLSEDDELSGRVPLAEFLESLDRVARFETKQALPAHEELIGDLPKRCAEIAAHHDRRLLEVLAAIGDHAVTASEISERVTWNKPYDTFNVFKKRSALGETLSHLQLLEQRSLVRSIDDGSSGATDLPALGSLTRGLAPASAPVVRWERLRAD